MSGYTKALAEGLAKATPTLDGEIKRLIQDHTREAVREAANRLTAGRVGRPKENDLPAFAADFEQDARDWLDGRDPNKRISSRKLARQFAKENPKPSEIGAFDRVYKKLRKNRKRICLIRAYEISENDYPVRRHLEAIEAVIGESSHEVWDWMKGRALREIETFTARGMELGPATTLREIKAANSSATQTIGGQFGGLGRGIV